MGISVLIWYFVNFDVCTAFEYVMNSYRRNQSRMAMTQNQIVRVIAAICCSAHDKLFNIVISNKLQDSPLNRVHLNIKLLRLHLQDQ